MYTGIVCPEFTIAYIIVCFKLESRMPEIPEIDLTAWTFPDDMKRYLDFRFERTVKYWSLRGDLDDDRIPNVCQTEQDMPALLHKWLADYAATGLPPAYLPMEEISHE